MELKKTPLNEIHKQRNAKMVPFGGWEMPVQYTSIIQEHNATRTHVGIFDVSHMGEIFISGKESDVLALLEKTTCNIVSDLKIGQVQYNAVVNEKGGLVDDITVYRLANDRFMICSNASNFEKVTEHLQKYVSGEAIVENKSSSYHQIALQGPKADSLFSTYIKKDLSSLRYYHFVEIPFRGEELLVSRTGYTGEDGFEIYSSNSLGIQIWNDLLEMGGPYGLLPIGLGARDTLRLEAKYPLYGHELQEDWTPVESGIGFIVKEKPNPYLGYERILSHKKNKPPRKIVGLILSEPGIFREQCSVFDLSGKEIGTTTSGTHSPSRKISLGLALLNLEFTGNGTEVTVDIRGQRKKARVETAPFWEGSVKKN